MSPVGKGSEMKIMLMVALVAILTAAIAGDILGDAASPERKPLQAVEETRVVPEPMGFALLGAGVVGLGIYAKKKNSKRT